MTEALDDLLWKYKSEELPIINGNIRNVFQLLEKFKDNIVSVRVYGDVFTLTKTGAAGKAELWLFNVRDLGCSGISITRPSIRNLGFLKAFDAMAKGIETMENIEAVDGVKPVSLMYCHRLRTKYDMRGSVNFASNYDLKFWITDGPATRGIMFFHRYAIVHGRAESA